MKTYAVPKKPCRCRRPKRDPYCMYCGHYYAGPFICRICKEAGIDGNVIRGTNRIVCAQHKKK